MFDSKWPLVDRPVRRPAVQGFMRLKPGPGTDPAVEVIDGEKDYRFAFVVLDAKL